MVSKEFPKPYLFPVLSCVFNVSRLLNGYYSTMYVTRGDTSITVNMLITKSSDMLRHGLC